MKDEKLWTISGEQHWEGIYTVEARSAEDALKKVSDGHWLDWQPTNLFDWSVTEGAKEEK